MDTQNSAYEQDWAQESIEVFGAREHNLQNIDVSLPHGKLTVITGLSGSGKSSLAFDTLYSEGQRRYIETFSAYARQFLGGMERPDVDKITGLSPVISIEQKTTNKNPRSTVGTITEIYDFLRLLFARAGEAFSYNTGEKMVRYSDTEIVDMIQEQYQGRRALVLAPVVRSRKGHYKELFEQIRKKGFLSVCVNGKVMEITNGMKLDRYKTHNVEVVVDKIFVVDDSLKRLKDSIALAMSMGKGTVVVMDFENGQSRFFSRTLMCPSTGIAYDEPAPNSFSFNSPMGHCPTCKGLGEITDVEPDLLVPDPSLSIRKGALLALGKYSNSLVFWQLEALGEKLGFTLDTPFAEIGPEGRSKIFHGTPDKLPLRSSPLGSSYKLPFAGVCQIVKDAVADNSSKKAEKWAEQFFRDQVCPDCGGSRLKLESRHYKIGGKTISELADMDIAELAQWLARLEERLDARQAKIAQEILKELRDRVGFLIDVGLEYLSLNRSSRTLSGGESQRIRLATQIGSQLVNVLYILDELSIGLHPRDNERMIKALKDLRDIGNSVVVVEHDRDMILAADHVLDLGPKAGKHGGRLVAQGTPAQILASDSLTARYLNGLMGIAVPEQRRAGKGKSLKITGARGNNLKGIDVEFPLGTFICVTGVSGSGKSTLINETLHPILSQKFYRSVQDPLPYDTIEGIDHIDKVIEVNQSPIGRTPRSNPATYTGLFNEIRALFEKLPESQVRGYKAGRFSFNVKGGRCETCGGGGWQTIEMNFLPDVYVLCPDCQGRRYNRETLEVRYKGKSISDVLDMTIEQAVDFFDSVPALVPKLKALADVGLGYVALGQPSTTLSGGESQRVKLATELSKRDTGKTLYILDEPTTGLHFEDIRILLEVLDRLVEKGNTVLVIEHNLDVIKVADHVIDIGPEGGRGGGLLVCQGTPEQVSQHPTSQTARFLRPELAQAAPSAPPKPKAKPRKKA